MDIEANYSLEIRNRRMGRHSPCTALDLFSRLGI